MPDPIPPHAIEATCLDFSKIASSRTTVHASPGRSTDYAQREAVAIVGTNQAMISRSWFLSESCGNLALGFWRGLVDDDVLKHVESRLLRWKGIRRVVSFMPAVSILYLGNRSYGPRERYISPSLFGGTQLSHRSSHHQTRISQEILYAAGSY